MMEKIYKDNEFMEYPKEKKVYNLSTEAIPIEWIKKWAKDNSNGEWSVEYRTVFNGILKDWEKENDR